MQKGKVAEFLNEQNRNQNCRTNYKKFFINKIGRIVVYLFYCFFS